MSDTYCAKPPMIGFQIITHRFGRADPLVTSHGFVAIPLAVAIGTMLAAEPVRLDAGPPDSDEQRVDADGDVPDVKAEPKKDADDVDARVMEWDAKIAESFREEQELQDEILAARARATDLDRDWKSLVGKVDAIRAEQKRLESEIKKSRESQKEAADERKKAEQEVKEAQKTLEEAKERLAEAETRVREANEKAEAGAKTATEAEQQLTSIPAKLKPLMPAVEEAREASESWREEVEKLESNAARLTQKRQQWREQIESLLRDNDRWVSFADEIAPIFHARCVACHNARNVKGGYNMSNFTAIRSESDSGHPIVPGDAEGSLLYQSIVDGWMPYESDPLPEAEVSAIRRWIELGARLGKRVDADAKLIRVIPRVDQPDPPARYRAAIPVTAVAIDPSGKWLASSGYHEALLWSLSDGKLERRILNVAQRVYGLAFHPDGQRIAVACGTPGRIGELKLFDRGTGELLAYPMVSEDVLFDVAFSPDGSRLATCGADGTIAIVELDDLEREPLRIDDHSDWVHQIDWSPDGKWLVSASRDKTAKVFDAETGRLRVTFSGHDADVASARFLTDGERVVSGGGDRRLRVWKIDDGKQQREIKEIGGEVRALRLIEGDRIVSVTSDDRVRVDDAGNGKRIVEGKTSDGWLTNVAIGDEGTTLVVGDQSGQLHRFRLNVSDGAMEHESGWVAVPAQGASVSVPDDGQ